MMLVISFLPLFTNRKISAISHCRYMDESSSRGPPGLCFVSGKVHVHVISPLSFGLGSSQEERSARSSDLPASPQSQQSNLSLAVWRMISRSPLPTCSTRRRQLAVSWQLERGCQSGQGNTCASRLCWHGF